MSFIFRNSVWKGFSGLWTNTTVRITGIISFVTIILCTFNVSYYSNVPKEDYTKAAYEFQVKSKVETKLPKKYAVFSASVPMFKNNTVTIYKGVHDVNNRAFGYLFLLPITVLSWKRLDYSSVIFLVYDSENTDQTTEQIFRFMVKTLRKLGASLYLIDVPSHLKVRTSQLVRLIPAHFTDFKDSDYMMTTDADLFPIRRSRYQVPQGKEILITNSACCGTFLFKNKYYKEYPMSTIGMPVKRWREIFKSQPIEETNKRNFTFEDIKEYFWHLEKYLTMGDLYSPGIHGDNAWSLDQRYVSIMIRDHLDKIEDIPTEFSEGFQCNRLDAYRNWMKEIKSPCLDDCHGFKFNSYGFDNWEKQKLLNRMLFGNKTVEFLDDYRINFINILMGKGKSK